MLARLGRFEMPKSLTKDEASAAETYAKFIAEPFEAGYDQTVGNSLRRVLLSSLEGAAITSIRITGAQHEFTTLTGIVKDKLLQLGLSFGMKFESGLVEPPMGSERSEDGKLVSF